MRYYSKEWDRLSRASGLSYFYTWKVTDRAAILNEELFHDEYQKFAIEHSGVKPDTEEQQELINQLFQGLLHEMEEALPENIKHQVADLRVLALGIITEQVLHELEQYSKEALLQLKELDKEYGEQNQYTVSHMSEKAYEAMELSFHDSFLIDCGYEGANLYMKLKMDGGYEHLEEQYVKLILTEAQILEGELRKELGVWICHELYYEEEQFRLYVRFSGGEITLQAADINKECLYSFFASDTPLQEQKNDEAVFGKIKDLISSGIITREETINSPLREQMGDEAYENLEIMHLKDFDSFGKLAVCVSPLQEEFWKLSGKKFIYEAKFQNEWGYNPEDMSKYWRRGEELLQFIRENCNPELELWVMWSDDYPNLENKSYRMEDFTVNDLEKIYDDTTDGIAKSRKITVSK